MREVDRKTIVLVTGGPKYQPLPLPTTIPGPVIAPIGFMPIVKRSLPPEPTPRGLLMASLASLPGFVATGPDTWEVRPQRRERHEGQTPEQRAAALERAEAKRARRAARAKGGERLPTGKHPSVPWPCVLCGADAMTDPESPSGCAYCDACTALMDEYAALPAEDEAALARTRETLMGEPASTCTAWTPPGAQELVAHLDAIAAKLKALPPVVTRIDAPSTVIEALTRQVALRHERGLGSTPYDSIPLHVDNDLPLRTVRLTYSDGTTRQLRL